MRASRLGDRAPARPPRRKRAARAGEGPAAERASRSARESDEDLARSGARTARRRRAARRGEMVVDFCAGAGGKTLALGALMRSTGRLYAFDISPKRLAGLRPRLARSGLSNVHPQRIQGANDARVKRLAGKIDRVLVDAPCSGLGTLRRNPDMKWRQTPRDLAEL